MSLEIPVIVQSQEDPNPMPQAKLPQNKLNQTTRYQVSQFGTTTPASPDSKKSQNETKRQAKKPRAKKNSSGIWIIEKSLDKKNWIATNNSGDLMWSPTRAKANEVAEAANENLVGIHYRVTRYEPSR